MSPCFIFIILLSLLNFLLVFSDPISEAGRHDGSVTRVPLTNVFELEKDFDKSKIGNDEEMCRNNTRKREVRETRKLNDTRNSSEIKNDKTITSDDTIDHDQKATISNSTLDSEVNAENEFDAHNNIVNKSASAGNNANITKENPDNINDSTLSIGNTSILVNTNSAREVQENVSNVSFEFNTSGVQDGIQYNISTPRGNVSHRSEIKHRISDVNSNNKKFTIQDTFDVLKEYGTDLQRVM